MSYDLTTPEGIAALRALTERRRNQRPSVCPGSGRRVAEPAMTCAPDERCSHCEAHVRAIEKRGEWQLASHRPLGEWHR